MIRWILCAVLAIPFLAIDAPRADAAVKGVRGKRGVVRGVRRGVRRNVSRAHFVRHRIARHYGISYSNVVVIDGLYYYIDCYGQLVLVPASVYRGYR